LLGADPAKFGFVAGGNVIEATAGLYGDLQGIAGRTLPEFEELEMPMLDGPAGIEAAERRRRRSPVGGHGAACLSAERPKTFLPPFERARNRCKVQS
jgi:hypothetical protein